MSRRGNSRGGNDEVPGRPTQTYLDFIFNVDDVGSSEDEDFVPPVVLSSDDDDDEFQSEEFSDDELGLPRQQVGLNTVVLPLASSGRGDLVSNRTRAKYAMVHASIRGAEDRAEELPHGVLTATTTAREQDPTYDRLVTALDRGNVEGKGSEEDDNDDGEEEDDDDDDEYVPDDAQDDSGGDDEPNFARVIYDEESVEQGGMGGQQLRPSDASSNARDRRSSESLGLVELVSAARTKFISGSLVPMTAEQRQTVKSQLDQHVVMLIIQQQLFRSAYRCSREERGPHVEDKQTERLYETTVKLLLELFERQEEMKLEWGRQHVNSHRIHSISRSNAFRRHAFGVHPSSITEPEVGVLVIDSYLLRSWRRFMCTHMPTTQKLMRLQASEGAHEDTDTNQPSLVQFMNHFSQNIEETIDCVYPTLQRERRTEPDLSDVLPQYTNASAIPTRCAYKYRGAEICGRPVITQSSGISMFACLHQGHQRWAQRTYFVQKPIEDAALLPRIDYADEARLVAPIVKHLWKTKSSTRERVWLDVEVDLLYSAIRHLSEHDARWNEKDILVRWLPGRPSRKGILKKVSEILNIKLAHPRRNLFDQLRRQQQQQNGTRMKRGISAYKGFNYNDPNPFLLTSKEVSQLLTALPENKSDPFRYLPAAKLNVVQKLHMPLHTSSYLKHYWQKVCKCREEVAYGLARKLELVHSSEELQRLRVLHEVPVPYSGQLGTAADDEYEQEELSDSDSDTADDIEVEENSITPVANVQDSQSTNRASKRDEPETRERSLEQNAPRKRHKR